MRGFTFVEAGLKHCLEVNQIDGLQIDLIENEAFSIHRQTVAKFLDDKLFFDSLEYTVVLDGVLFNKKELIKNYQKTHLKDVLIEMYHSQGEEFFDEFRGSFSGIFIDKKNRLQLYFTSHVGEHPLYYFDSEDPTIVSSRVSPIVELLKLNKLSHTLSSEGAYCLLTHGYMLGEYTLVNTIKKVPAGSYLKIKDGKKKICTYFSFENKLNFNLSESAIIESIDQLFLNSIKQIVAKNQEYNYTNYASLSAGLDTRVINYAFKRLGVKNVINFSYSQSKHYDETISQQVAADLQREWYFKALDDASSITDNIDEVVRLNDGMVLYFGPGQVSDSFDLLDDAQLGLISTGLLGGSVVSLEDVNPHAENFSISKGAYSTKLIHQLEKYLPENFTSTYSNVELFKLNNRLFNGANFGAPLTYLEKSISFSPFYEVDFLSFCLSIPPKFRLNYRIYDKWILKYYPEAAKFSHNGIRKIGQQPIQIGKKQFYFTSLGETFKQIKRKIGLAPSQLNSPNHMNPLDYWYTSSPKVKAYLDGYFQNNIDLLANQELKNDCISLYSQGNTIEKTQVLTLLGANKLFFTE